MGTEAPFRATSAGFRASAACLSLLETVSSKPAACRAARADALRKGPCTFLGHVQSFFEKCISCFIHFKVKSYCVYFTCLFSAEKFVLYINMVYFQHHFNGCIMFHYIDAP